VVIGGERFVKDEAAGSPGGAVTATKRWIPANLEIDLTPRIAFGLEAENLSLDVIVDINDFSTAIITSADTTKRHLETTAILNSGDVLALGGLLKMEDKNTIGQTPILGQIPILGYLFKQRKRQTPKTSLTVFIMPTIVQPKLRGGMGVYTKDYIKLTKRYTKEGMLFDSLKDPITRWFFQPENKVDETIDQFVAETQVKEGIYPQEQTPPIEETSSKKQSKKEKKKSGIHKKMKAVEKTKLARRRNSIADEEDPLRLLLEDQENPLLES